jgi:succinate dehydrogenase/fumarate reductase cytochrome b subunit
VVVSYKVAVVQFPNNQSLVAGEWVVAGVDPKASAFAFALLSFASFFKKRYLIGYALAEAALSFHVLIGIYALFCVMAALLLTQRPLKENSITLFRQSWPMFITGIFGIITIFQYLLTSVGIDQNKAWEIYEKFRIPHHVLSST